MYFLVVARNDPSSSTTSSSTDKDKVETEDDKNNSNEANDEVIVLENEVEFKEEFDEPKLGMIMTKTQTTITSLRFVHWRTFASTLIRIT